MKVPMTVRRDFSFLRVIAPVPRFGIQMPLAVSPTGYRELDRLYPSARRNYSAKPFSPEEMKHNFAIRALKKPGFFARRPYIYLCVRCQQIFLVNERRGSVEPSIATEIRCRSPKTQDRSGRLLKARAPASGSLRNSRDSVGRRQPSNQVPSSIVC